MKTFKLPDLGEGLQEAEIVAWHIGVGERVVADQPLLSVETAKAVVEVPSPWSGRVSKTYGQPGEKITVGAPLVEIETIDETRDSGTVVGVLSATTMPAPELVRAAPARAPLRVKASPAVRQLASERGIDLANVIGSGPGGVVTQGDVEVATRHTPVSDDYAALRGVRRAMAEAMVRAGTEVVPATVTDEAIIDAWASNADPTTRLIRAIVAGCQAAPALNAWLDGKRLARRLHDTINLGVAMETADGLFAPVLRNIAERSDDDLRSGLDAMKRDVAARKVPLAELLGQTITVSNFGMLGGLHAALVIVPPQVAILGAGRIHRAPRLVGEAIRASRVMPLSLTFDHRAVTGAEAIAFLNAVIACLEVP